MTGRSWLRLLPFAVSLTAAAVLETPRTVAECAPAGAEARSGNGGVRVHIDIAPGESRMDVWVNYELEVNVWRDLSPEVEQMNTDGTIRAACQWRSP